MEIKPGLQQEFENIMDVVQAIGFGVSVLITCYIALRETRHRNAEATQRAQEEAKKRQAEHELAMVQEQIGVLFGPLKGLLEATRAAMLSARKSLKQKRLVPREAIFLDEECTKLNTDFSWFPYDQNGEPIDQNVEIVIEWRRWVRTVILPCQEDMLKLIRDNTHLLPDIFPGSGLPSAFTEAMEHFLSYRVLINQWDREEADNDGVPVRLKSYQNTATVPFPRALPPYVDAVWGKLIRERDRLMQLTRLEIDDETSTFHHHQGGQAAETEPRQSFGHPSRWQQGAPKRNKPFILGEGSWRPRVRAVLAPRGTSRVSVSRRVV